MPGEMERDMADALADEGLGPAGSTPSPKPSPTTPGSSPQSSPLSPPKTPPQKGYQWQYQKVDRMENMGWVQVPAKEGRPAAQWLPRLSNVDTRGYYEYFGYYDDDGNPIVLDIDFRAPRQGFRMVYTPGSNYPEIGVQPGFWTEEADLSPDTSLQMELAKAISTGDKGRIEKLSADLTYYQSIMNAMTPEQKAALQQKQDAADRAHDDAIEARRQDALDRETRNAQWKISQAATDTERLAIRRRFEIEQQNIQDRFNQEMGQARVNEQRRQLEWGMTFAANQDERQIARQQWDRQFQENQFQFSTTMAQRQYEFGAEMGQRQAEFGATLAQRQWEAQDAARRANIAQGIEIMRTPGDWLAYENLRYDMQGPNRPYTGTEVVPRTWVQDWAQMSNQPMPQFQPPAGQQRQLPVGTPATPVSGQPGPMRWGDGRLMTADEIAAMFGGGTALTPPMPPGGQGTRVPIPQPGQAPPIAGTGGQMLTPKPGTPPSPPGPAFRPPPEAPAFETGAFQPAVPGPGRGPINPGLAELEATADTSGDDMVEMEGFDPKGDFQTLFARPSEIEGLEGQGFTVKKTGKSMDWALPLLQSPLSRLPQRGLREALAGQPVNRPRPISTLGAPTAPSAQSWANLPWSAQQMFQSEVQRLGVPWEESAAEMRELWPSWRTPAGFRRAPARLGGGRI